MPKRRTVSWKLNERRMPRSVRTWRMISLSFVLIFTVEQRASSQVVLRKRLELMMAGMISMIRMHLYQRQIVRMMCPQRQILMARNQRNLNPESLITLRKTETLVKELREHQLLRQYIMVLLVRVVLIISIQLVRRLSISAI